MDEQLKGFGKTVAEFWKNIDKKKKTLIITGIIVFFVIAFALTMVLNRSDYVELYPSIQAEEATEVIGILQESGVNYRYESNGKILVPKSQENELKMKLSIAGHPRTGSSYNVFTDNIDFMSTDSEKRTFKLYQLQETMKGAIKTIPGIKDAIVTINVPEEKNFAWEQNTNVSTASVKITLQSGAELTSAQVRGIAKLVSKSVPGLTEENTAIIDNNGVSLSTSNDYIQMDTMNLRLEIEKELQKDMETNAKRVLATLYGAENVDVVAKCKINFDKKISEMLQYLPDETTNKGIPSRETKDQEIVGEGTATGGTVGTEANAEIPTYPNVTIDGENIYFKDGSSVDYVISQLKEQVEHETGTITDSSMSIIINKKNMDDIETAKLKDMASLSTGVEIDKIALYNMDFYVPPGSEDPILPPIIPDNIPIEIIIIAAVCFILLLILIIVISMILGKRKKKKKAEQDAETGTPVINAEGVVVGYRTPEGRITPVEDSGNDWSLADIQESLDAKETKEQAVKKQIVDFTQANPEIAAQLIRTWLKGDEE